jgi:hypothetical protein
MHVPCCSKCKGNAVSAVTGLEWPRRFQEVSSSSAVSGLQWPRGFQEVKVPRFHDNGTGWW